MKSTSRVAEYRKESKTVFGREIGASTTNGAELEADAEKGKSLHYFRKNHI
jgi:hypothetical protein